MKRKSILLLSLILIFIIVGFTIAYRIMSENQSSNIGPAKPVIYLYPEEELQIEVELKYEGDLTYTYPEYEDGWKVSANPDGTLLNILDGKEYSYLFWEGTNNVDWNITEGFVIPGNETAEFLQEKLAFMGLNPKEYNEFIVYWLPIMQENKYNLIYFAQEEYTEIAQLNINPKPDSMLRIFMVYKKVDELQPIKEQQLVEFCRDGFTVIEWGGSEIIN